jgi:hypothetical protein
MSRDYRPMIFAFLVFVFRYHGHAGLSFYVVIRHGVLPCGASGVTTNSTEIILCTGCHG